MPETIKRQIKKISKAKSFSQLIILIMLVSLLIIIWTIHRTGRFLNLEIKTIQGPIINAGDGDGDGDCCGNDCSGDCSGGDCPGDCSGDCARSDCCWRLP